MGNPLTKGVGNVLTKLMGNVLTEIVGKVLDIYIIINTIQAVAINHLAALFFAFMT